MGALTTLAPSLEPSLSASPFSFLNIMDYKAILQNACKTELRNRELLITVVKGYYTQQQVNDLAQYMFGFFLSKLYCTDMG